MAYHYLGDIQHVTCQTASGQRRSPLSDISYNSGQELKDEHTGRVHHRQHTDGTDIVVTDIVSADTRCPYGDTSVSSARRREQMYNELYQLNKVNSERIYWKTTVALPNMFDDEQLITTAQDIAMSFSAYFNRPVDYSVHRKPATKNKPINCHVHIAVPERKYSHGKWGAKSVSYYVNKDGTLNTQKQYKDENGNDTRKPRTINKEKPVLAVDKNGHEYCVNQLRDSNGRRKWKMQNVEGLTNDDITWMHNEVDRIQNEALKMYGIDDTVKRNHKRTTEKLKEAGLKAIHIGKKDNEMKDESYQEKVAINEEYKRIATAMNNNYEKLDKAESKLKDTNRAEAEAEKQLDSVSKKVKNIEAELQQEKELAEQATIAYVKETLQPEENYIKKVEEEFKKALTLVDKNLSVLRNIADKKIDAITKELTASSKSEQTEKDKLINEFMSTNRQHWKTYRNAIDKIETSTVASVKKIARKQWHRCPGWKRCEYIRQTAGNDSAFVYEQYLAMQNEFTDKAKDNNTLKVVTCEEVVADVIKSIPSLQSQVDRNKSAIENAETITAEVRGAEQTHGKAELFLPPMNGDALALWASIPDRMVTMMEEKQGKVIRPLENYYPAKDTVIFEAKLRSLNNQVSQTNAGSDKTVNTTAVNTTAVEAVTQEIIAKHRADYDKSAKMRDALLTKLREETAKVYAEYTYKEECDLYDQYLQDKEPFDICAENLEAIKRDTPTNYAEIQRTQKRYDRMLEKLKERYPGHPLREPDITVNQAEAASMFKEYRADLVKRKIQELHLPVSEELIKAYDTEAKNAQNLWQFVKADKEQNNQQPDKKQTADNSKQLDQKPKIKSKDKGSDKSKPDNTR